MRGLCKSLTCFFSNLFLLFFDITGNQVFRKKHSSSQETHFLYLYPLYVGLLQYISWYFSSLQLEKASNSFKDETLPKHLLEEKLSYRFILNPNSLIDFKLKSKTEFEKESHKSFALPKKSPDVNLNQK